MPISTIELRRLRLRVMAPRFRVNLCGIVCGISVAASVSLPLPLARYGLAEFILENGGASSLVLLLPNEMTFHSAARRRFLSRLLS